jgi:O-antigen/teichoic acid export membrane protein
MNLARTTSWYAATALLNSAVPFMLLPVFTSHLSPSDFGLMSTIIAYVAILSPIIIIGLPALFSADFHRLELGKLRRKSTTWLLIPFAIGGFVTITAWLLRFNLAEPLGIPSTWVPLVPLLALLGFIPQLASVMLQMDNRPIHFASFQISQGLSLMVMAIIFVVFLNADWEGRLWSMLIVGSVASIVGILFLRPFISSSAPRKTDAFEALKFGAGLLPHAVLSQIIRQSDRLFIVHFIGFAAAGEYAVGWQFASIMLVVVSTFNQAWTPYLFKNLAQADQQIKFKIVKQSYVIASSFFFLFLIINITSPLIFDLFISSEYHSAKQFIPCITLGYLFMGFYVLITDYIFFLKKTYLLSILTTANAILNIILNYVFITQFGSIGVACAFAVSSFITFLAAWLISNSVFPMPWIDFFSKNQSS